MNEQTCTWTGADLWASNASRGVQLIREPIAAARWLTASPARRSRARVRRLTAPRPLSYGSQTACRNGKHVMKGPVLTGGVT